MTDRERDEAEVYGREDLDHYLQYMLWFVPKVLPQELAQYDSARGDRKRRRRDLVYLVHRNMDVICRGRRDGRMSEEQLGRYVELLRQLRPMFPELKKRKVPVPQAVIEDMRTMVGGEDPAAQ